MNRTFHRSIMAGAIALALSATGSAFANDNTNSRTSNATSTTTSSSNQELTGKQKATAIGAGSGAAVGAVVGGPVGALVGAGVGAYVGHEGTDAKGRVSTNPNYGSGSSMRADGDVRRAQVALNAQGYSLAVDGIHGPATESAIRDFQGRHGLAPTGTLDEPTMERLGLKG